MKKHQMAVASGMLALVLALSGCNGGTAQTTSSSQTSSQTKTITDAAGNKVTIPSRIDRIADGWQAHNEVVTMLGDGKKIVGTVLTQKSMPWLYQVNPQMKNAKTVFNKDSSANPEELAGIKADIIFLPLNPKNAQQVSQLGIPTVQMNFTDFSGLKQTFELTGDILGDSAKKRADKYVSYLNSKMKTVTDVTSKIPDSQKLKVLHVTSLSPLTVDGSNTIIDAWIKAAGGVNAAAEVQGNNQGVSMEQLIQWNPDVVIVGSTTNMQNATGKGIIDSLLQDPAWQKIKAVSSKRVYTNPAGAFYWDRYSAEEALQIQWAAKTLYPEKFSGLNIEKETISFYKTFLDYNLSKTEANKILNGEPPAQS